jgi:hypothetical protein
MGRVFTCNQTGQDTKIAAWPGGVSCPADGSALACDDDTCPGTQSDIQFQVTAGQPYMLQIGNWPGAMGGTGSFKTIVTGSVGGPFCFCDPGSAFPNGSCGNPGAPGNGCANGVAAGGAHLAGMGNPSVANDTTVLVTTSAVPGQPGLFFQGNNAIAGGNGVPFGDGLRCAGGSVIRLQIVVPNGSGQAQTSVGIAAGGGVSPGDTKHYQYWYRNPGSSPCGSNFNLTNGWTFHWQ